MDNVLQYSKFIAAIVTPLVVALLVRIFNVFGAEFTQDVATAVSVVVTGFFVWLVPNKES